MSGLRPKICFTVHTNLACIIYTYGSVIWTSIFKYIQDMSRNIDNFDVFSVFMYFFSFRPGNRPKIIFFEKFLLISD